MHACTHCARVRACQRDAAHLRCVPDRLHRVRASATSSLHSAKHPTSVWPRQYDKAFIVQLSCGEGGSAGRATAMGKCQRA